MEEERRLAFVALTRAEKELYLSEAEGRNLDASPRYPSRFLLDIDPDLLAYTAPPKESLIRDARDYIAASEKYLPEAKPEEGFAVGARIRHEILGEGTVLEIDRDFLSSFLKDQELPLYAAALDERAVDVRKVPLCRAAVAVGSEGRGLSPELIAMSDQTVVIPMGPDSESLNAAVAAAVLMWEACR
jgi:hypothetical protein